VTAPGTLHKRTFDEPDEVRHAGTATVRSITIGQITLIHATHPPGWRWSKDARPVVQTHNCRASHVLYILSGRLHVVMEDGAECEFGPGEVGIVPPGHDAYTVGDEAVVYLDVSGDA
jgi:mannose-6-phosphate isomerase-like protein (cupin superfamily)